MSSSNVPAHKPYVPDEKIIPEFTVSAVLVGAVLGILFGASSLYLVLKVGMTISASIPVAVLSITLFRIFSKVFGIRRATILENNIVQTTGSAGESIAFGVGVTMPAVMILGFELEITRVMVVSVLGGMLGILMMIPLRRAFIVKQHGTLKYPEGTACADVLVVGETGGSTAKTVFIGFGLAFVHKFLMRGMKLWKDEVARPLDWFAGATPAIEATPELLGVGYIIGTRISCIMVAGGILSYFVLAPAIMFFGSGLTVPLYPGTALISTMDSVAIRNEYIVYIGAGAVATGGIIGLFRALPLILSSIRSGLRDMKTAVGSGGKFAPHRPRHALVERLYRQSSASFGHLDGDVHRSPSRRQCYVAGIGQFDKSGCRGSYRAFRISICHCVVEINRRDRLVVESHLRHDRGHAAFDVPYFSDL